MATDCDMHTIEKVHPPTVTPAQATEEPPIDSLSVNSGTSESTCSRAHLIQRWNAWFEAATNLESRGIQRVPEDERLPADSWSYWSVGLIWFSVNLGPSVSTFGLLGPLIYQLSFVDSALCALFASALGSFAIAVCSLWGPRSGNRTMIVTRWFFGYWPTKLITLLQIVILIGYALIGLIIGAQLLSAAAGGQVSILISIIISAAITLIISLIGVQWLHHYDRWAWIPVLAIYFIMFRSAGQHFDTSSPSVGDPVTINANRLTFFSLCLSAPLGWPPAAADYFVYSSESTKPVLFVLMAFLGSFCAFLLNFLLGIGLASGVATNPDWAAAYEISSGQLFYAGLAPLGSGFAGFCAVILSLSIIAYNVPGTYSAALGVQILGRYGFAIPRWIWVIVITIIYTACAAAGKEQLYVIFSSFLPLVAYWVVIFLVVIYEEHYIFNKGNLRRYKWDAWNDRSKLPIGLAAFATLLIGYAGAVLSMDQVYWIGPIARLVGDTGADLGLWVAAGFALIVFPPLRYLEIKFIGR